MGVSATEIGGIINDIITQEIQSTTTMCINKDTTKNSINQWQIGSDCSQTATIDSTTVFSFNTACFNNSKMMGSITNNITNSIMSTLEQKTTGLGLGTKSANLKDGIINLVNNYITQQTMTTIINSIIETNTSNQVCVNSGGTQIAFIDAESFGKVISQAVSSNETVMQASTTLTNYISQALSQKTTGALVAIVEAIALVLFVGIIFLIVIAIVGLVVFKKFL